MNKILNGYKKFIKRDDNPINVIYEKDLSELNLLKDKLIELNIYNIQYYDDFINWLCDEFSIECCFTCGKFIFLDDLLDCEDCGEYICNYCNVYGCSCDGVPDEDDYNDNINCYYL